MVYFFGCIGLLRVDHTNRGPTHPSAGMFEWWLDLDQGDATLGQDVGNGGSVGAGSFDCGQQSADGAFSDPYQGPVHAGDAGTKCLAGLSTDSAIFGIGVCVGASVLMT